MNAAAPLHGLVLTGGRSTRMKRDKAALAYHGETQLEHAWRLLAPHVARRFVSVRADQRHDPLRAGYPQIIDSIADAGPAAGILAAFEAHPDAAWLVLACDLPHLDARTLGHLVAQRDPTRPATAYRSAHDGLPEPLCAIWEPASRAPLTAALAAGRSCPRKFLINADTKLLDPLVPHALDNVNESHEYWSAMSSLNAAPAPLHVKVQYFALLREQAGRSEETLATLARTPRDLYEELRARHSFTLPPELLRVAVNAEFGDWTQPLADGDAVVFIPPVAGG
ncbi:MAG TPA: NTP transferase domain-containing protein [Steroidobacteraceae bacterium]|nr:NTP transferase domain-containing protein [Steroidobacteraceae bacterium]HNS28163.1 NTP transferase domain-containing protein [Steroidobacteraceae bacterium]